jgi:hypothetical protein
LVKHNNQRILARTLVELARHSLRAVRNAADLPKQHSQRIVKLVHDALFEWDDGVVRDANLLGTNFRTAFCDVAISKAKLALQKGSAVEAVEGMHLETGDTNEEARPRELLLLVVFAKNVTHVLAEKAFDALAKLLDAVHIQLRDFPFHSLSRLERRDFAVDTIVPRNVRDKVFNAGKSLHRENGDGLVLRQVIHSRFAGQARAAIDFRGARAALSSFAVPADCKVRSEVSLNVVERVKDNHARSYRNAVVDGLSAV